LCCNLFRWKCDCRILYGSWYV